MMGYTYCSFFMLGLDRRLKLHALLEDTAMLPRCLDTNK